MRVVEVDRVSLWQYAEGEAVFYLTHARAAEENEMPVGVASSDIAPWMTGEMRQGRTLALNSLDEAPLEASVDRQYAERVGIKSVLAIPLRRGDQVCGCIAFATIRCNRHWSEEIVDRLSITGGVFTAALERKRLDEKRAQSYRELAASEKRYRNFVADSTESIWCFELEKPLPLSLSEMEQVDWLYRYGHLVAVNDALAAIYGFECSAEMMKWRLNDFMPRDLPGSIATLCEAVRSRYQLVGLENVELDRYGNRVVALNNISGDIRQGKLIRIWGTAHDITRLRQVERDVRLRSSAVEAVGDGCVITTRQDNSNAIVYTNAGFTSITGYNAGEVRGQDLRLLQGPGTDRRTVAKIGEAIARGETIRTEILNYRKDGSPFWNLMRISPVRDTKGAITHHVGIIIDISERKQKSDEIRAVRNELAHVARVASMGELTGALAHELNQPLAAILSKPKQRSISWRTTRPTLMSCGISCKT